MNCQNCGKPLSCGCQKRVATNGKQCCTHCINQCNQLGGTPPQQNPNQVSYPPGPYRPHN